MLRRSGVRPAARAALTLACLPLLAACSSGGDSDPEPDAEAESSAAASPSEAESDDGPTAEEQWAEALATRSEPIGFQAEVAALGDGVPGPLISTRGTWQSGPDAWSATTTARDPETGREHEFGVRSVGDQVWLQVVGHRIPPDVWLAMAPGELPLGQLAMVAGEPRYLTVLDQISRVSDLEPEDGAGTIEGRIPLSEALSLFNQPYVEILGFPDPASARGSVQIIVDLVGPGVEGYRIAGADVVAAAQASGGLVDDDYVRYMEQVTLEVDLEDDARAPETRAPDPSQVISSEDLSPPSSI